MKQILVTGATGFIGRGLCEKLHNSHCKVRAAVRTEKSTKLPGSLDQSIVGDIGPSTNWEKALLHVDCIVHLAACIDVVPGVSGDPLSRFRSVNVDGTIHLARQAVRANVKRFIYISSIKVNGEISQTGVPFTPDDEPAPSTPYAVSKFEAERALLQFSAESGLEIVIIRSPLVYGPGVQGNFLRLMHWMAKGMPLPLGAIRNRRSLVALDNLLDLIVTCTDHPAAADQTFLVSDGEDLSTTELLQQVSLALGRNDRLIPMPAKVLAMFAAMFGRQSTVQRLCGSLQVDITKTKSILDWSPPNTVGESLRLTAQDYFDTTS
ncbi:UDP-glucose 4-epimerase family protein [Desulfogranum marinum]|uniref:UDP-glucose 4-epimerase family protein n=1 Tax=Desulfogranum marinum TaxID=453220 RepID=UPI001964311B|nr:SDR family oxidoreductase [Desulfogranum marinum]